VAAAAPGGLVMSERPASQQQQTIQSLSDLANERLKLQRQKSPPTNNIVLLVNQHGNGGSLGQNNQYHQGGVGGGSLQ